jgi:hypothetical protein
MHWAIPFFIGCSCGFTLATIYYRYNRLIRTKHEWYTDPVIRSKYPDEAERALREPDTW